MKLPGCISRSTQFAGNMLVFANQFLVFINHLAPIHQQKSHETKNGNKEHEGSPITLKVAYHQPFIIKKNLSRLHQLLPALGSTWSWIHVKKRWKKGAGHRWWEKKMMFASNAKEWIPINWMISRWIWGSSSRDFLGCGWVLARCSVMSLCDFLIFSLPMY